MTTIPGTVSGARIARRVGGIAVLALAVCAAGGRAAPAAETAPVWPGPRGPHVFVEAEDFQPQGRGWTVVDERPLMLRPDSASGLKVLSGAGPGDGTAVRKIEVPAGGDYRFWVRFEKWPDTESAPRAPFRVTIAQGGQTVFSQEYDDRGEKPPGRRRLHYTAFTWAPGSVTLAPGAAEITIEKAGPVRSSRRRVDCVLLTTDADYRPDHRDFGPQMYLRIRLQHVQPERVYFYLFVDESRSPWYVNLRFDRSGCAPGVRSKEADYLAAGEATPWTAFSRRLYDGLSAGLSIHATVKYGKEFATASDYSVDFATAPEESAIVKTIRRSGPGDGLQMILPADLVGDHRPKSDREFAEETAAMVAKLPVPAFGRVPTGFPLIVGLRVDDHNNSPGNRALETRALQYLGINGLARRLDDRDVQDGFRFGVEGGSVWYMGPGRFSEPQVDKIATSLQSRAESLLAKGHADRITMNMLMDEAGASSLELLAEQKACQQDFRRWLREQKRTPAELGAASWDDVNLATNRAAEPPLRYLLSQQFRAANVADFFRQVTEIEHRYYPPSIRTTQNYSDGAVYLANFFMQGNDYFTWFKHRALDLAWSEDWTNNGSTRQLCGWNVALLRSATKYFGQPIGMYVITSAGRRPLEVKLKAYSDIAQGARQLQFYSYTPRYQSHESSWYQRWGMYAAVAELSREIGAAEPVLLDAQPRPAQTAILYSIPADIWDTDHDNTQGMERMHTYLALRHGQVPVDVLSDEDARDGRLRDYQVAYLFGEQLDRRDVRPLVDWVRRGGTLVLSPGAGMKDECNQPSPALDEGLRLDRKPLVTLQQFHGPSGQIGNVLRSQGRVSLLDRDGQPAGTADLLACRQPFGAMRDATAIARFEDGQPAAVEVRCGRGRVFLFGFMPALAYIHDAWNKMWSDDQRSELVEPLHCVATALALSGEHTEKPVKVERSDSFPMPYQFNAALRQFILEPTTSIRTARPVEADVPQVEATFLEGEKGWVVPLANYTGSAVDKLKLTIRPGRPCGPVCSARGGVLVDHPGNSREITVTIPLESTDFVYAEWRKK